METVQPPAFGKEISKKDLRVCKMFIALFKRLKGVFLLAKGLKALASLGILVGLCALFLGCTAKVSGAAAAATGEIVLAGLAQGEQTVTLHDIKALEPYEGHVAGKDSQGGTVAFDIKGAQLSELLALYGLEQADLSGIRLTASDGYSIEIPHDILAQRDVILAYETDGAPLDKDNAPVHVFIPGERAMYWVRMLSEIDVIETEPGEAVSKISIMEALFDEDDYTAFEMDGQTYAALDTRLILDTASHTDTVRMTAADGLEKNETPENFYKGVIQMEGPDAPKFASDKLPVGMSVKKLRIIQSGGQAFYFLSSAAAEPVSIEKIVRDCGLVPAEDVLLRFDDGSEKVASPEELKTFAVESCGEVITADGQQRKLITIQIH